jgi:hypothetical protein
MTYIASVLSENILPVRPVSSPFESFKPYPVPRVPRLDPSLDLVGAQLLDTSAAKHKRDVRPKKNHPKSKAGAKNNGDRYDDASCLIHKHSAHS